MNTKRQTIWLVSMLSLMVVLSAYYLFTEDTTAPAKQTVDNVRSEQTLKGDATEVGQLPEIKVTEVSTGHGADPSVNGKDAASEAKENSSKSDGTNPSATSTSKDDEAKNAGNETSAAAKEDQEKAMLDKVEAEGVMKRSSIEELQMQRAEKYQQEMEKLMSDLNSTSSEKTAAVHDEMGKLEEHETKLSNLETELQKQYQSAVITQDNDKYQVLVQSNKLEAKDAVEIVDKVMKDLNVTQDKIVVEYVSE